MLSYKEINFGPTFETMQS